MTAALLALALVMAQAPAASDVAAAEPTLEIDPCIDVERPIVEDLVEIELRGGGRPNVGPPTSVAVHCLGGGQEIRVEPWASLGRDGIRVIELRTVDGPAAREARSRELALAIAEVVRRLTITQPIPPTPPPPPPPPVAPPPVAISRPPTGEGAGRRWRLGVLCSLDAFTGGQKMAGADIVLTFRIGRTIVSEVRVGGRLLPAPFSEGEQLTARAGVAGAAIGPALQSQSGALIFAPMFRAQGYAMDFRAEPPAQSGSATARLAAFTLGAEPRLFLALSRHISLAAGAGVGILLHGIVIRTQGSRVSSITGAMISGSLGAVVAF